MYNIKVKLKIATITEYNYCINYVCRRNYIEKKGNSNSSNKVNVFYKV